ncbi:MAG: aminopeptidase, partial [Clostridia bacterium]|nr:aminopeptidase [Clostridia bacterium]
LGLDRSMILGYGHDDRVCAYAELEALFMVKEVPQRTCCLLFADKEEIGSVGATGMNAKYFENAFAELMNLTGDYCDLKLRRGLAASKMLSCDVSAGYDPNFASAFERKNAAFLGRGVCFNKYTGARGKSGSNDANAEYMAEVRKIMDDANVSFQTAELGRVDLGGGGTIAYICALYCMNVIDSGVAVLSMHAPWEIISKADLYEAVKGYHAFLLNA